MTANPPVEPPTDDQPGGPEQRPAGSGHPVAEPGWRPTVGPAPGWSGWTPPSGSGGPPPPAGGFPAGGPPAGRPQPPGAAMIPHCYRHPDRETYVSCQRCGRPICPDCMRPAAVGFHCPEEGDRSTPQRRTRTTLGGPAQVARQGLVTQILIGLCVAAYILQGAPGLTGRGTFNRFTGDFAMIGIRIAADDQYYRLLTAAFLHAGVLHILFNMYALYLLGFQLEAILGRARYLALFVAGALGGNTLSYVLGDGFTVSVGASTAIFAFFAAYYIIARRLRVDSRQILIVLGINLAITFSFSNIDKWGHLGGLAVGAIIGLIYAYVPPRRVLLQAGGVAAVLALLFAAAIIKSSTLV
ncbi:MULTISPECIES: rhomboid family intramembrane serine protease [unclassified Frankia]|uniref:rhomboid family intramembrane serine protease n=1 Tax=unclassified Frankia TaxID=2632575 RepID=UPI001F16AA9F|nr:MULTISPECIES: rhomboid family intramembrane serine protease [unclassified Frankia]